MDKSMRTGDFLCGLDFPTLLKPEFVLMYSHIMGFPGGALVKDLPANAGDADSIPTLGQEDPPEKEMATHSSILAWEIP